MSNKESLDAGEAQQVAGLNFWLRPKIFFLPYTASEVHHDSSTVEFVNSRDQLIAFPALVGGGPDFEAFARMVEFAVPVNHSVVDLPLTRKFHPSLTYRLAEGHENFNLVLRGALRLPMMVSERFRYFAFLTKTISLFFGDSDSDDIHVVSLRSSESDELVPRIASVAASKASKAIEMIQKKSTSWEAYAIGNPSLYADSQDFNDDQFDIYEISSHEKRIPIFTVSPICFMCGGVSDITLEHCTPNWLMTRLSLHPITAPIVCSPCNGRLGSWLEKPMQDLYDADSVLEDANLASLWAVKTAVTLALASNIHVPESIRQALANGSLEGTGIEVFAEKIPLNEKNRFQYTVTRLRRSLVEKCFLLSFAFPGYGFLVVQWQGNALEQVPAIARIYPSPRLPSRERIDGLVLPFILQKLSGDEFQFTAVKGKAIKSKR